MRTAASLLTVAALSLAACSGASEPQAASTEPTEVEETVAPTEDETPEEVEGEGRDPEALFGVDVCTALLPALDGETDGLDRYATDEVLATLDQGETVDPVAPLAEVHSEDGSTCEIAIGDTWVTLTLEGDGHVGHRAVDAVWDSSYPDHEPADPAAVAAEVEAIRATDAVCDGQAAELPEGAGDHIIYELPTGTVVAVVCDTFAYQSTFDLRGWDGANLTTLMVEQWMGGTIEPSSVVLGSPRVDQVWLVNLEKARGLGDCGVYSSWFLEGDFLGLAEVRERACDDDAEYVEPTEWPQVYPAG